MTAAWTLTGRGWLHAVLGRWGWTLLGAVLLVAFLGLTSLPMHQSAAPKWRMFQLQTWAMSGLLWWLLLGLPLVQSLHHMAALRLPDAAGRKPQYRGPRGAQAPTVPGGKVSSLDRARARKGA